MGNFWLKFKVWTKVSLFGLLMLYVLLFVLNNNVRVKVWFWFSDDWTVETSILKLVFFTLLLGVIGTLLVRTTFVTLRQIREMQSRARAERAERDLNEMKAKAAMLRARGEQHVVGGETIVG